MCGLPCLLLLILYDNMFYMFFIMILYMYVMTHYMGLGYGKGRSFWQFNNLHYVVTLPITLILQFNCKLICHHYRAIWGGGSSQSGNPGNRIGVQWSWVVYFLIKLHYDLFQKLYASTPTYISCYVMLCSILPCSVLFCFVLLCFTTIVKSL